MGGCVDELVQDLIVVVVESIACLMVAWVEGIPSGAAEERNLRRGLDLLRTREDAPRRDPGGNERTCLLYTSDAADD